MQTRGSKFVKFQEIKLQEMPSQVPIGHTPRTMTVHVRGELTRSLQAGDEVSLSGVFLPLPYTGFQAIRAGLVSDTYLDATDVTRFKKSYEEEGDALTEEMEAAVEEAIDDDDIYSKLARSLAPEIYGHEDVKKARFLPI